MNQSWPHRRCVLLQRSSACTVQRNGHIYFNLRIRFDMFLMINSYQFLNQRIHIGQAAEMSAELKGSAVWLTISFHSIVKKQFKSYTYKNTKSHIWRINQFIDRKSDITWVLFKHAYPWKGKLVWESFKATTSVRNSPRNKMDLW